MPSGRTAVVALSLSVVLVAASGCLSVDDDGFGSPSTPATSSTALQDREDVIAALARTQAVAYAFTVRSDVDEDGTLTASGAVDPGAKTFTSTVKITSPTHSPNSTAMILVGGQLYERDLERKSSRWIHIDPVRLAKSTLPTFDAADPTGLAKFAKTLGSVERGSAPGAYLGRFNAHEAGLLPIGAPEMTCFCVQLVPFRATVDAQGYVTSISVDVVQTTGRTLKMTTTLTGFTKAVPVKAPAKAQTIEATDDFYRIAAPTPSAS